MAVLNPRNAPYNATGNGSTDDQAALQNCINDAKSGGHSVYIPPGKYNHSSQITIPGPVQVSGENSDDAAGQVSWLYATDIRYRAITLTGSGAEITKLKISGTQVDRAIPNVGTPSNKWSIWANDASNFRITHCFVRGTNTATSEPNVAGILIRGACTNGYVARNCVWYTTADSIHITGSSSTKNNTVEYNHVFQSGDDGTAFVTYANTARVVNCISRYNYVSNNRGGRGCSAVGSQDSQIVGNFIEGGPNGRAGVIIASEGGYTSGYNDGLLVQDNTIYHAGGDGTSVEGDPGTHHGALLIHNGQGETYANRNLTINRNQILLAKTDSILVTGAKGSNVDITNNTFYAPASGTDIKLDSGTPPGYTATGNVRVSSSPPMQALGGVVTRTGLTSADIAARRDQARTRVGVGTTWTIGGTVPDPLPSVFLPASVTVMEGNSVTLTVTKSGTGACSVTYATATGTATTADFTAIPATTLSFSASETTKTIEVQTTADALSETSENFSVVLSAPTGCTLGNAATCVVTITDQPVPVDPIPLPYQSLTTFDITVNLNSVSTRSFVGPTYSGKHLRIIPKTTQDTAAGLYFEDCASVTIIGGSFKPASRAVNGSVDSGASLYFKECGAVYLEGVLVDNTSITQGHAVLVHAGAAATEVTIQNCRMVNVTGSDTGVAGTVFSTGGTGTGKTGFVRVHNLTGSTNASTRGIYVAPGTGGGIAALYLRNVNLFRVNGLGGFGFYHLLNAGADYNAVGYPINFDNVWGQMGAGQAIETQGVWPNVAAGSNALFGAKFAAVRAPDPTNGNRIGVNWPQMRDLGREWEGFAYEGTPAAGDFVKDTKVGLTYVPGVDLVEVTAPDPVPNPAPPPLPQTVMIITVPNLATPTGWTNGGPGTVTIDPKTGAITITNTTAVKTYTRYVFPTVAGKRYWLTYDQAVDVTARQLGTVVGAGNLAALTASSAGDNKVEVIATGAEVHLEFSRSTIGTSVVGSIVFQELLDNRTSGRRLNGRSQTFTLDALGTGLRTANYRWYLGGWVRFTFMPMTAMYLLDFGRADPASTFPGAGRIRVVYDPLNQKLLASTCQSDGNNYRENSLSTILRANEWYYIACYAESDGDVRVMVNKVGGQVWVGNLPALDDTVVCRTLCLGGRIGGTFFAPVTLSDWVWCSDFIPDPDDVNMLADGTRPGAISGFAPTFHWPMAGTGTQEFNVSTTTPGDQVGTVAGTPLTANGSPVTVMGLGYLGSAPPESWDTPLDVIIF